MEMEFKDSSRRRTLVLVVGVLLALTAGAGVFYLSSQGGGEDDETLPTREIVVAAVDIPARKTIEVTDITTRVVPADATNETAFQSVDSVAGGQAAVTILALQPITPNMLTGAQSGSIPLLGPTETISPLSPVWRAVSLSVPAERAVAGSIGAGSRVDLVASIPVNVEPAIDQQTGEEVPTDVFSDQSTKIAWMDVEILSKNPDSDLYVFKMDLHQAEEVAHAQTAGANFTMLLRPPGDTREVDRSTYGETTNRLLEQYNFPIPEVIDVAGYPQPSAFPTPFPNEPYLSPPPSEAPSPSPVPGESAAPEGQASPPAP